MGEKYINKYTLILINTHSKMKFILTKKDIVAINQKFDQGNLMNEASLDFALSYAKKTENWTKALAYLVRAVLVDHVFAEANKRTTAVLIKLYADFEGFDVYNDKVAKLIKEIMQKNITSIERIEELIKDAIRGNT
jgi:prophage maintenance system killer protein